jgi:hypothetical protein
MSTHNRGGRRPGSGRKPSPPVALAPLFDLVEEVEKLPDDDVGRRRRAAMLLGAYAATDAEIAAALGGELSVVEDDVRLGRILLEASVRAEIMAHATASRGRPWRISAAKWALKHLDGLAPTRRTPRRSSP